MLPCVAPVQPAAHPYLLTHSRTLTLSRAVDYYDAARAGRAWVSRDEKKAALRRLGVWCGLLCDLLGEVGLDL